MRGYACIGLDNPKTAANIACVSRIVANYDAAFLALSGIRYRRHSADVQKTYRHIPLLETDDLEKVIPYDCVPVAIDIIPGARTLMSYTHPERAFYIFGAEDATLGERTLSWCRDVVYVPTSQCMNLAITVGVVMYDRMSKQK